MAVQKSYKGAKVTLSATKNGSTVNVGIASQSFVKGANTRFDWRFEIYQKKAFRWNYVHGSNTSGYVSNTSGSVRYKSAPGSGKTKVKLWVYKKGTKVNI